MGCPHCGGQERTLLAPGFYRCTSAIITGMVPPGAPGNPTAAAFPLMRTCGCEYQEATSGQALPTCGCGMFAVALCTECQAPLCGSCLRRSAKGGIVCSRHLPLAPDTPAPPPVAPPPMTVEDYLDAARASERARVETANHQRAEREEQVASLASDLHAIVRRTVRSVVESASSASSLRFKIQTSERRKGALGGSPRNAGPHVEDPTGIATHHRESWVEAYGMYRSYCEFDGIYPLYCWVSEKLPGPHGTTRAQLGGIWCNVDGLVVAATRPHAGIVISEPHLDLLPKYTLPTETHVGDWLPTSDLIRPTSWDRLSDDDFHTVVKTSGLTSTSGLESRIAGLVASILVPRR